MDFTFSLLIFFQKPPGSKQGEQKSEVGNRSHKEDSYHRHYSSDYSRLQRQHSLENYFDESKTQIYII